MLTGKELAEVGMARAVAAQEAKEPAWRQRALEMIKGIAETKATVHIDDVIEAMKVNGLPKPGHYNSWGYIWKAAIYRRYIERTNTTRPCEADPAKHHHNYPIYRSLLAAPAPSKAARKATIHTDQNSLFA